MFRGNNWLHLALIAPMLWSAVVLIDDNLLRKVYRSAGFAAMAAGLFGVFPFLFFAVTDQNPVPAPKILAISIATGIITVCFYYFYFKALSTDEPSTTIAILNLAPVIVLVLAAVYLREQLSNSQYAGIAVILAASFYLSVRDIKKFKFSKSIFFCTIASLFYAVGSITAKYAYEQASFRTIFPWIAFGYFVAGTTILSFGRFHKQTQKLIKKSGILLFFVLIFVELLNLGGEFVQGLAISRGPVTVIRTIEGVQPIYILLFAILLRPLFPSYFREHVDKKLPGKLLGMVVMLGGLYLIAR